MGDPIFFYLFATIVIGGAIGVVFLSNPLSSALSLIFSLAGLAGLFVLLQAHFLAAIQVLVYAGAVMVLFIFVIMMLNLEDCKKHLKVSFASLIGFVIALNLAIVLVMHVSAPLFDDGVSDKTFGTIEGVGQLTLTRYLIPFEIVSLLLTIAIVGAVILAKKDNPKETT